MTLKRLAVTTLATGISIWLVDTLFFSTIGLFFFYNLMKWLGEVSIVVAFAVLAFIAYQHRSPAHPPGVYHGKGDCFYAIADVTTALARYLDWLLRSAGAEERS